MELPGPKGNKASQYSDVQRGASMLMSSPVRERAGGACTDSRLWCAVSLPVLCTPQESSKGICGTDIHNGHWGPLKVNYNHLPVLVL